MKRPLRESAKVLVTNGESRMGLRQAEFTVLRLVGMAMLLGFGSAGFYHCEGNRWLFFAGTVLYSAIIGAGFGVPFGRVELAGKCGVVVGTALFLVAIAL